ncbi:MAG: DUF3857 domain-containing protein [Acidobacteria bacterium]|nr:DUF3857 domain-containing protein [Acidobacteriota bacterium]
MSRRALLVCLAVPLLAAAAARPVAGSDLDRRVEQHVTAAIEGGLRPDDLHHLVLMYALREGLSDWSILDRDLDRLAAARPADPLMVDAVRSLRARAAAAEGHPEAARELFRTMGGLEQWWASGPQPLQELADFSAVQPPPADGAWRHAEGVDPLGWVRIAGLAWPTERQLIYLATTVTSTREQPVAVRLGAAQAARVWLNGRQCLTTPQPLARGEDQAVAGGWLEKGSNLLVVAVATERDEWWLRVRLTAPEGSPLKGVHESDDRPVPVAAADQEPPHVRDLLGEIEDSRRRGDPGAAMARAAFYVVNHPEAAGSGAAAAACRDARAEDPGEARLLESMVTTEAGAVRNVLEGALKSDPGLTPARVLLARWYHGRDLDQQAHDLLATHADDPEVAATDLDIAADQWGSAIYPDLERLAGAWPRCVEVQQLWLGRALQARLDSAASTALDRLEKLVPGADATRRFAEQLATQRGDGSWLRKAAEDALASDPNQPELRIRLSRLLTAASDPEQAQKVLARGLERCPTQVDLLLEEALVEHERGRDKRAAELAHRLLKLRPQSRPASRLLKLLGQETESESWRRSAADLLQMAAHVPAPEGTLTLLDHHEVRFLPGNLTEERVQRVVLVGNPKQADSVQQDTIPYVPERQRLRVLAARVLRSGGAEMSAQQDDTPRLADPAVNMFYDTRLRVVSFPEPERGDLLELTYILSETAQANESGPYDGGLLPIRNDSPVHTAEIELTAPAAQMPAWELANLDGQPRRTVDADGTVHLRWQWHDLPAAPADAPPAPGLLTTPHLAYSNHPQWGELADWYRRDVAPRVVTSRPVADTAHRLVDGLKDHRARVAAIYHFVTDEIRYVALEFGEHRFRPFSADWVLAHKMGDCKDKAALMVALFRAVGIEARMVLVRTANQGPPVVHLALMEDFNHAIAYLPEDKLWLDGTATGHDPFLPPGPDQGAWVLVINGLDSSPTTTPEVGSGVFKDTIALQRDANGAVRVHLTATATGDAAGAMRARFGGTHDPLRFAQWLRRLYPGAELVGEPVTQIEPGQDPVKLELDGSLPRSALSGAGGVRVRPGDFELASQLTPTETRRSPLLVAMRPDLRWTLEVDLGRQPRDLPEPVHADGPYGKLDVVVDAEPSGYRVRGFFHLQPGLVPAARAPELRRFLVLAQRTLERKLEAP